MDTSSLRPVRLKPEMIPEALALSQEAGWNQIDADLRFMFGAGIGFGYVDDTGTLVASGLTVEFPDYAWISMILVTKRWQRRGLATRLMRECMDALQARGLPAALDASQQGREVYLRLGFRDCGNSTRFVGKAERVAQLAGGEVGRLQREVEPVAPDDLEDLTAYDTASSGTDRSSLLQHLLGREPGAAFLLRRGGRIRGYVLCRAGRNSVQIGPLVADDDAVAAALLQHLCATLTGTVCLDLFDDRAALRDMVETADFVAVTRFVRMVLSAGDLFPVDHRVHVIGGPELS